MSISYLFHSALWKFSNFKNPFFENFKHLIQAQILPVHIPPSSFPDKYINDKLSRRQGDTDFHSGTAALPLAFCYSDRLGIKIF